jgi:hypothetical protein
MTMSFAAETTWDTYSPSFPAAGHPVPVEFAPMDWKESLIPSPKALAELSYSELLTLSLHVVADILGSAGTSRA